MRQYNNSSLFERIIAVASYLSAGMAGFIWWIIAILTKQQVRQFLIYHIMQSIFISIAYFIFIQLYKLIFIAFAKIPIINGIVYFINGLCFSPLPLFWGLSLLQVFTTTIILYLVVTSLLGWYSYIPWVSDIIKGNTGTK